MAPKVPRKLLSVCPRVRHNGACMALTKQVKGVREDKREKFDQRATRPQDMPACVDCVPPGPADPMVQGYDGKWRCMLHTRLHNEAVFRESGNAAPVPSDDQRGKRAEVSASAEAARQAHAKRILDKYGVTRRTPEWV